MNVISVGGTAYVRSEAVATMIDLELAEGDGGDFRRLAQRLRQIRGPEKALSNPAEQAAIIQLLKKWHCWIATGQLAFTDNDLQESAAVLKTFGEDVSNLTTVPGKGAAANDG